MNPSLSLAPHKILMDISCHRRALKTILDLLPTIIAVTLTNRRPQQISLIMINLTIRLRSSHNLHSPRLLPLMLAMDACSQLLMLRKMINSIISNIAKLALHPDPSLLFSIRRNSPIPLKMAAHLPRQIFTLRSLTIRIIHVILQFLLILVLLCLTLPFRRLRRLHRIYRICLEQVHGSRVTSINPLFTIRSQWTFRIKDLINMPLINPSLMHEIKCCNSSSSNHSVNTNSHSSSHSSHNIIHHRNRRSHLNSTSQFRQLSRSWLRGFSRCQTLRTVPE